MKRRIISMWMAVILLLTAVDLTVFAAEPTVSRNEIQSVSGDVVNESVKAVETVSPNETPTVSGQCGDNLTWSYESGTLTIMGTGATWDYGGEGCPQSPWYELREEITQLVLDDNITRLAVDFSECINLKGNVKIPSKMTVIMAYTFAGCTGLTSVEIPKGIKTIAEGAFQGCTGLSGTLVIPEGVTVIGEWVFEGCSGLTGLEIPDGIRVIGDNAFAYCDGIEKIRFHGAKPESLGSLNLENPRIFAGITANAYYPANDSTWEGIEYEEGLGGNLTWIAVEPEEDKPEINEPEIDDPKDEPEIDEPGNIVDGPDWGDIIEQDRKIYATEQLPEGDVSKVPDGMWIAGMKQEGYTYSGNNIVFTLGTNNEIRVYDGKILLQLNQDYTISYKNNKKAYSLREGDGEYKASKAPTVTIKGKGNYSGSIVKTFVINPMDIASVKGDRTKLFEAPDIVLGYNGKVQKGTTKVTYTDETGKVISLKANTDFTYEYPGTNQEESNYNENAFKEAATYEVTIKGKGNYTGSITFKETITNSVLLSKVKVSSIPAQMYDNGKALCPDVTLTYGGETLSVYDEASKTGDYTVQYENNNFPGTAKIILEGKGDYAGTRIITFKIKGMELKKAKMEGFVSSYVYTGDAIEQNEVVFSYQPEGQDTPIKLVTGENGDYFVKYSKNEPVGTATVIYEGNPERGWTGTVKKTYKIKAYDLNQDINGRIEVTDADGKAYPQRIPYVKSGAKPSVKIKYTSPNGKVYILTEGKDYKLSYTNNKKITDGTDEKKVPKILITGKGNFSGKRQKETFKITVSDISQLTLTASDVVFQNKAGKFGTSVVITDTDGKALKAGTDYEKVYKYYYNDNSLSEEGSEVPEKAIVPKDTVLQVVVIGKGNYAGDSEKPAVISGMYRIVGASLAKANVKVNKQYYTGKPICPDKSQIVIRLNGKVLAAKDYEIVSYENNVKKGNAKVTIEGTGNYGGRKTVNYTIANKPMDCMIVFNANGATSGNMKELKLKYGVSYTLTPNAYKREGYDFIGWSTKSEGSVMDEQGKEIVYVDEAKDPIQIGKEDRGRIIILYAQWKIKEYKITYKLDDGVNHEQNPSMYTMEDEITLKEPTREGYTFLGWYADSNFSESKKIISISKGSIGDKVLYAKWRKSKIEKVEVPQEYLNVNDFGAYADDDKDDTNAIERAVWQASRNADEGGVNTVYVPAGTYMITPGHADEDGDPGISLKSNVNLIMDNEAILYVKETSFESYCVISAKYVENITIKGGKIQGERYRHIGQGGEYGHGIAVYGGTNIEISNVVVSDNWGDGVYLGTQRVFAEYVGSNHVVVKNCEIFNNRRNNISIVDADDVWIEQCYIADANGTAPQCGICIEPNWNKKDSDDEICRNITIKDTTVSAYQNKNSDKYMCFMTHHNPYKPNYVTAENIKFINCVFNGYVGNYSGKNLQKDDKTVINGTFDNYR